MSQSILMLANKHPKSSEEFSTTIISHKNKYVYSYIPKAACTTIRHLLAQKEGIQWYPNWTVKNGKYLTTQFDKIPKKEIVNYPDYIYFTFVRNPWSRLVSCFFDKIISVRSMPDSMFVSDGIYHQFRKRYPGIQFDRMDFSDFVEFVLSVKDEQSDGHFRSQHTFLSLKRLDFIGKVENLYGDLKKLFGDIEQPPVHGKTMHRNYTDYYNAAMEVKVGYRYAKDIEIFGYSFGDTP